MNMVERTYNPEGYSCQTTVMITEEQAKVLDRLAKKRVFDAYFWAEKIDWLNKGDLADGCKAFRVNGRHMVIGPENASSLWRGCGGAKYIIEFIDGKHKGQIIESTNVWHQGTIPNELRDILKDNAIIKESY